MNDLIVLEKLNPLEIFTPQGTEDILTRITKEAKSVVLDISTPDGRSAIKSLAYKIAKSKTYLDDLGKDLVSAAKEQVKLVDAERKRIRDTLDELKEEVRAPLTAWEDQEKDRIADHENALAYIQQLGEFFEESATEIIESRIKSFQALAPRNWQEFQARYEAAVKSLSETLESQLVISRKRDAEQAELARLRQEEADRRQREHEERLKADAAARAKAEAETAARAEAEALAAKVKADQEAAAKREEAARREKAEAEERARRAEEARLAAEAKAEADRKAAAEKARQDAIAAAEKAKRDAELAAQREREKIEAERKAEAKALAKREADKKHRAKINNEALDALTLLLHDGSFLDASITARAVIEAIAKGNVPHVRIQY